MKYIDRFKNIDAFLNSELQQLTGDRIATIDGFELPILKKKTKIVTTIDPSTNEEIEEEELQDVWMVPIGEEEKKVEHDYKYYAGNSEFVSSLGNIEIEIPNFNNYWYGTNNYYKAHNIFALSPHSQDCVFPFTLTDNDKNINISSIDNVQYQGSTSQIIKSYSKGKMTVQVLPSSYGIVSTDTPYSYSASCDIVSSDESIVPFGFNGSITFKQSGTFSSLETINPTFYTIGSGNQRTYMKSKYENGVLDLYNKSLYAGSSSWASTQIYVDRIEGYILDAINATNYNYKKCDEEGTVIDTGTGNIQVHSDYDLNSVNKEYISFKGFPSTSEHQYIEIEFSSPLLVFGKVEYAGQFPYFKYFKDYSISKIRVHRDDLTYESLNIPEGTTSIDSMVLSSAYMDPNDRPTEFSIPEGVTRIENDAFNSWTIKNIAFPSTLEYVGQRAFQLTSSADGITSVTLPSGCQYFDTTFPSSTSFVNMTQDPMTMMTTFTPMTVTGGQVYSCRLSDVLDSTQKESLKSMGLSSGVWMSIDPSYSLQNTVTIADFDNIFDPASDDPMNQPSLYLGGLDNFMTNWTILKEVSFPSYAQGSLGQYVFQNCSSLSSISGIDHITSIGQYCFANTNFSTFTVPQSVTSIGSNAFEASSNPSLTSLAIPMLMASMLSKIEGNAFAGQSNLLSVTLPEFCEYKANSFHSNTVVTGGTLGWDMHDMSHYGQIVEDGALEIESGKFWNNTSDFQSGVQYYMPSSVTSIGDNAFNNCSNLTYLTIHEGVTSIGMSAFNNNYSLSSITLPSSLTSIGMSAFNNCSMLQTVTFPMSWNVTSIPNYCFYSCPMQNSSSISIPSGTTSIGDNAFMNCSYLSSVTLPSSLTSIGMSAFIGTQITSVTLPNGCTWYETSFPSSCVVTSDTTPTPVVADLSDRTATGSLSSDWFTMQYGYDAVFTKVIIPEGVTEIQTMGSCWFSSSSANAIKEIDMPSTLVTVGSCAFSNMSALETIDISYLTGISTAMFDGDTNLFKNAAPTFNSNIQVIPERSFRETMKNVSTLDLSTLTGLVTIGSKAFANTGLTSVTLPSGCSYYLNSFPANCVVTGGSLQTYTATDVYNSCGVEIFPAGTTDIQTDPLGNYYNEKQRLTELTVPATITNIGNFTYYENLTSLTFEHTDSDSLTIASYAFQYDDIRSLTIPACCTSIGQDAFAGNENLSSLTFAKSEGNHFLESIGQGAFANTGLTSVSFPMLSGATYWPNSFPEGCVVDGGTIVDAPLYINSTNSGMSYSWNYNFTKIYIQNDVTMLTYEMFKHSENIVEVEFAQDMVGLSITPSMFEDCTRLTTVTFNGASVSIQPKAFANTAVTAVTLPAGSTYETDSFPAGCVVTVQS